MRKQAVLAKILLPFVTRILKKTEFIDLSSACYREWKNGLCCRAEQHSNLTRPNFRLPINRMFCAAVRLARPYSGLRKSSKIRVNGTVVKYWESIEEKLKASGWEVRWTEAMHDGEIGWTATAVRGKERHSSHANDVTLAFQELESSCSQYPCPPALRG